MQTITYGGWDSIAELRKLRAHTAAMDQEAADRQAHKESLAESFLDVASEGDVRAPCFFVRSRVGAALRAPAFADVFYGSLDDKRLIEQAAQFVTDAAIGVFGDAAQEKAAALLKAAAENFAEGEL